MRLFKRDTRSKPLFSIWHYCLLDDADRYWFYNGEVWIIHHGKVFGNMTEITSGGLYDQIIKNAWRFVSPIGQQIKGRNVRYIKL